MSRHIEPAWDAPLDGATYLREVPAGATIKGMFPGAIAAEAKRRSLSLPHASERYLPFLDYPLASHMALLLEAATSFFPGISPRRGLRKLGRAAVGTFTQTTIGGAMLGGLMQPDAVARAMVALVRAYAIALAHPVPQLEMRAETESSCILRLTDFWIFLDSHQIGIIEGLCRACGVRADVTLWTEGLARGEFSVSWKPDPDGSGPHSSSP